MLVYMFIELSRWHSLACCVSSQRVNITVSSQVST